MDIYKAGNNTDRADCLIVHSFGTSTDIESVNHKLAAFALHMADGRPIMADRAIIDSLSKSSDTTAMIAAGEVATHINIEGKLSGPKIKGDGTWGTLNAAKQYMDAHQLTKPIMVAQAWHATRVAKQATKLGMDSILPKGLPRTFDKHSDQFWTRSIYFWIPVNLLGSILLKRRGQL
ncbi:MAG: hypothetical protein ABWY71_00245 [Candidatus Saccharimonadales bacterium]